MTKTDTFLKVGAAIGGTVAVAFSFIAVWASKRYQTIIQKDASAIPIDAYIGKSPTLMETIQAVLTYTYAKKGHAVTNKSPYSIVAEPSRNIDGLKSTRRAKEGEMPTTSDKPKPPLIIGSMRKYHGEY